PGAVCPSATPGCNPGSATSPPSFGTGCSATDLGDVAKACSGTTGGQACDTTALSRLVQTRPACFDCLQQFLYDGAVAKCLAPFLNQTCNHELTCFAQCTAQVCSKCASGDVASCRSSVATGACRDEISGAFCAQAAYGGPGAFCDPSQYSNT